MVSQRLSEAAVHWLRRRGNSLFFTTKQRGNNFSTTPGQRRGSTSFSARPLVLSVGGVLAGGYLVNKYVTCYSSVLAAAKADVKKSEAGTLSRREQRFHDFASCEVNGQIVMTPYDFIESLIENEPRFPRYGKVRVTKKDIERIIANTPLAKDGGSTMFFRDMHQDGVITYSEYLFLVTILTKSTTGLKIALKMMDVNDDKMINLKEFEQIERMINQSASKFTSGDETVDEESRATTLLLHLFGADGTQEVSFEEFFQFMDNLRTEVLELEFHRYSKGMRFISEVDFARILLRSTTLTEQEHSIYMERLKERIKIPKGISIEQFKVFNTFLSNIDDFFIAIAMTHSTGQDLDKEYFRRAVHVVTGMDIDPYMIEVVFSLFDTVGNEKLSEEEFIGIMKDRLRRGFGKISGKSGFRGFKHCLKREMNKSSE